MALNVTTAVFRPGFNIATASPSLVQWDQGQTLQFEGVELPSAYQVEFTNAVTVQAITMIGNENGVEIPNELLQQSFPITAYIVLHETAEDRETEYWATIYVKARQKPREETPDPEQSSVIDQTIAALQEGVAEAQAASQAVQNMGVEAETLPEGSEATVEKTVDPETGEVTLEFGIPEGRHGATGATPDIQIGTVTTGAPGSQADASITGTREEPRLNLTIPQGPQGDAGVTSVNGKTGAVTLDATDVGAKPASYEAPVSSVNGKTGAVVLDASDVGAKPASYEAPVSSVNGKTGAVVLSASDVGAKPASYEAPVSSVNEKTGAVVLDSEDIRYDSTETYSDGTVGKELGAINSALSSLSAVTEIIDTASGAIASFPDGSGLPMRSLVAQINPVQDLHGQSSPYPAGGGKNLFGFEEYLKACNVTYTKNGNTYTVTIADSSLFSNPWVFSETNIGVTLSCSSFTAETATNVRINLINEAGTVIASMSPASLTVSGSCCKARINWTTVGTFTISEPMIELGYLKTSYAPYANLCPISGWTGVQGQRTGVNLFDKTTAVVGYIDDADGELKGTQAGSAYRSTDFVRVDGGKSYYIKTEQTASIWGAWYDENKAFIRGQTNYANAVITAPSNAKYVRLTAVSSNNGNLDTFAVNYPSTDTEYHVYQGEAISVSFPTTVYGGMDEVISGNGTSTFGMVDLGTLTWYQNSGAFYALPPNALKNFNGLCSNYAHSLAESVTQQEDKTWQSRSGAGLAIWIIDSSYTTAAEFKTAMSGVQLCYELETPQAFTHEGQAVSTVVGQNNVFVDTGDVIVTYQASIKGYIDKVLGS